MIGRHSMARRLAVGALATMLLLTLPPGWQDNGAVASGVCSRAAELRATTCRLVPGQALADSLADTGGSAMYRLDALTPGSTLNLTLTGGPADTSVAVLNWRGEEIGTTARSGNAPDARLSVGLRVPGAYGVRVSSADPRSTERYEIVAGLDQSVATPSVVWPPTIQGDAGSGSLASERRVMRTIRGAVAGGPGVGRQSTLGAPPSGMVGDFTLVSDVQFEQILGPSALTVRFRFEPEAGGGSGYLLTIEPIAGEASLESFEEGLRKAVVSHAKLPVELLAGSPRRLVLRAIGSEIAVTLDGQEVLSASDARYPRGLIAVGAVTWSDPAVVIFDHLLVTTPAP